MAIKTLSELLALFPDNEEQLSVPEFIRDFIDSVKVGGTFGIKNNASSQTVDGTWEAIDNWNSVGNVNGWTVDAQNGQIVAGPGTDGFYRVWCGFTVSGPAQSSLFLQIFDGPDGTNQSGWEDQRDFNTGNTFGYVGCGGGIDVVAGDKVGIGIKSEGPSRAFLFKHGFFTIERGF